MKKFLLFLGVLAVAFAAAAGASFGASGGEIRVWSDDYSANAQNTGYGSFNNAQAAAGPNVNNSRGYTEELGPGVIAMSACTTILVPIGLITLAWMFISWAKGYQAQEISSSKNDSFFGGF